MTWAHYTRGVMEKDPAQIPWDDMAWIERTPSGERFKVAMAPRGVMLHRDSGGGDPGTELVGFVLQAVVALTFARDKTWKVGVFRVKPMQLRRCVFKRTGLSEEQAEQEVQRLRECVRNGDLSWQ